MNIEDWDNEKIEALKKTGVLGEEAAHFISEVVNSPFFNGFLGVYVTINNLNAELQQGVAKIVSEVNVSEDGQMMIADKAFERSNKYITEIQTYYEQLDYLRKNLLPKEQETANEKAADLLDEVRLKMKRDGKKV